MFESDRSQKIIISAILVIAIINGIALVDATSYYSGSILLAQTMDTDLTEIRIKNFNPDNTTINPKFSMIYNFRVPENRRGEISIIHLVASVYLNDIHLSYSNFHLFVNRDNQNLYPGDDKNFTISTTISELIDKQAFYNASALETWIFEVVLTIDFRLFNSDIPSVRRIPFIYEGISYQ